MFRYSRVLRSFHVSRAFRNHTIFKAPAKESTRALLKAPSRSTYSTNTFHVKLRENASSLKTIATSIIAAVCCFQVYAYLVLDPLGGLLLEFVEDMPDEDEEENSPWFIPFPGTTKEFPSVPYKESDPDWQEIVKFSRDEDLILRARKEVANIVIEGSMRHPLVRRIGTDMKTRRVWLDVDYPTRPPPTFEISGLEWGDSAPFWTTKPIEAGSVFCMRKFLWPSTVTLSFWSSTKVLFADNMKAMSSKLGFNLNSPSLATNHITQPGQLLKKPLPSKDGPPPDKHGTGQQTLPGVPPTLSVSAGGKGLEVEDDASVAKRFVSRWSGHIVNPRRAFNTEFQKRWRRTSYQTPRGCVIFSGLVEIEAARGRAVCDVRAAWDPKTRSVDMDSLFIFPRRVAVARRGAGNG